MSIAATVAFVIIVAYRGDSTVADRARYSARIEAEQRRRRLHDRGVT